VYVAPSVQLENCIIGPNVSIDENARLVSSIVRNSIIESGAVIENSTLENSLIGRRAHIHGHVDQLNVGDNSTVGNTLGA
jgi:glucose-1-phosphate thymidylyltransferase